MKNLIYLLFIILFFNDNDSGLKAQSGSLDVTFNPSNGANSFIWALDIQENGKIIVGGQFTTFNDINRNGLVRLNEDGSVDNTFNPGSGMDLENTFSIRDVKVQSDDKIIAVGSFETFNGVNRKGIVRLNPNGSIDNSFNPGTGANNTILTCNLLNDGKILIGGQFSEYDGTSVNRIVKLNSNGSIDNTFSADISFVGTNAVIYQIINQNDGKILITGSFVTANGNGIARLNSDGSIDTTFNIGNGASSIYAIGLQSDGKIIVGGNFNSFNGNQSRNIARLNFNGSYDESFEVGLGTNNPVRSIFIQDDGKIVVGGDFSTYSGISRVGIFRANTDGSIDNTFVVGTGASGSINSYVRAIAPQNDDKLIIAGGFTQYNGTNRNRIARINTTSSTSATSLSDITDKSEVIIFPNPTNGMISIRGIDLYKVIIYNLQGKLLNEKILSREFENIDLGSFNNGVYLLEVFTKISIERHLIIKK